MRNVLKGDSDSGKILRPISRWLVMSRLLIAVFSILSHLPLAVLQAVGVALGWLVYLSSPRYAARMRENLAQSGLATDAVSQRRLLRQAVSATGMGALELVIAWGRSPTSIARLVKNCNNWHIVEEALEILSGAAGEGDSSTD